MNVIRNSYLKYYEELKKSELDNAAIHIIHACKPS